MLEIRKLDQFDQISSIESFGLGMHFLADFYDCVSLPNRAVDLEEIMLRAAHQILATVVTSSFHEFSPHGLSGVVVIADTAAIFPQNVNANGTPEPSTAILAVLGLIGLATTRRRRRR